MVTISTNSVNFLNAYNFTCPIFKAIDYIINLRSMSRIKFISLVRSEGFHINRQHYYDYIRGTRVTINSYVLIGCCSIVGIDVFVLHSIGKQLLSSGSVDLSNYGLNKLGYSL